jgi:hypothetical protein
MSAGDRYDRLGAALRALDVPDYEPGFDAQLRRRLEDVTPGRASRPRAATGGGRRRASRSWRPLVATAALAALLLAFVLAGDRGTGGLGTDPATAAELGERVARAVTQARTLSGVLVWRERIGTGVAAADSSRTRFLVTAAGDQRLVELGAGHGTASAYRTATATEIVVSRDPTGPGAIVSTGLASGSPDAGPDDLLLQRALAGIVPALRAAGDRRIESTRYAGRPAWRLRSAVPINKLAGPGGSGDRLDIVVDRATGFPLRVRETLRGRLVEERRIVDLRVDGPAPASAFRLAVPRGHPAQRIDYRYRRVTLRRGAAIAGYAPLEPALLPRGYRRAETSVSRKAGTSGNEGANPVSRGVVATAYRRGLDLVLVTTRRRGEGTPPCPWSGAGTGPCWEDPIGAGEGNRVVEQPLRLTTGALAASRARLILAPRAIPHVWALTSDLVVTISGDLSRAELIRAAASLKTIG